MSFADLPTELIQNIASFCEAGDIHSLICASRALHTACDTALVFQSSFLHHASEPSSQWVRDKRELVRLINVALTAPRCVSAPAGSSQRTHVRRPRAETRMVWSRLAAAAPRLADLSDELDELMVPFRAISFDNGLQNLPVPTVELLQKTRSLVGAFATFAVLGYAPAIDLGVAAAIPGLLITLTQPCNFVPEQFPDMDLDVLVVQQAFCLVLGLLHTQVLNNMHLLKTQLSLLHQFDEPHSRFFAFKRTWEGRQTILMMSQAFMAYNLRSSFPGRPARVYLPSHEGLPFAAPPASKDDAFVLPLPSPARQPGGAAGRSDLASSVASFASTKSWSRWHLEYVQRISKEFTEGEWFGYHTWGTSRHDFTLHDGPMENIRFRIVEDADGNEHGTTRARADGCTEPGGTFALEVKTYRESASIGLRKIHSDGSVLEFPGCFTPFGIAALLSEPQNPLEWLWLWKREWMEKAA